MDISAGWTDEELSLSLSFSLSLSLSLFLSQRKTKLARVIKPFFSIKKKEIIFLLLIWVEPVLNLKIVRAVLTERQTSDCNIKCSITFSFQWKFHVYWPQFDLLSI